MKVGDLVMIEARNKKQTLRPPYYGKIGIIVGHTPGPLGSPEWVVVVDRKVRQISYLYLKVVNESR